jgi:AcrR family transcriptional regulator
MGKPRKKVPPPRKPAKSHDELPRHADWQNPRVVQILDAASRCFAREGFANTTVQEIAQEAGLTKSMIHYYFESKQVLILELQAFVYERYFRRVQQKLSSIDPESIERVPQALWEIFEIVKDKPFLQLQLELLAEAGRDPNMRGRIMLAQDRSREFIEQGAQQVVNATAGPNVPLPRALTTMIQAQLLGLRIHGFISGDNDEMEDAYKFFIGILTHALENARDQPSG